MPDRALRELKPFAGTFLDSSLLDLSCELVTSYNYATGLPNQKKSRPVQILQADNKL